MTILRLSIKRLGDWTNDVEQIKRGTAARIWGPYGHFTELVMAQPQMPLVMIGGGIGITPFLSMVASEAFARRDGKSTLIYAVPECPSAVYLDELRTREGALPQFTLVMHHSDEEGYVDHTYLESVLKQPFHDCLFLICGPTPLMEAVRDFLTGAGVRNRQIIVEDFEIR